MELNLTWQVNDGEVRHMGRSNCQIDDVVAYATPFSSQLVLCIFHSLGNVLGVINRDDNVFTTMRWLVG